MIGIAGNMKMDLAEIPTDELVHEVERRLACLNKPEKRVILIG
jgi:adenylate kinase